MNRLRGSIQGISIFISLILLALVLRLFLFYIPSFDLTIIGGWYDKFTQLGRIGAFSEVFYNYPPAYLYLVDIMTTFRFIPKEQALKIIPVIFDFVAAFAAFKLVRLKYPQGLMRYVGFFVVLFTPTVFVLSGMWGQCDMIYTSFLLWSLYFILKEKPFFAIFFFSVAFSFKLQTIFFAPVFLILLFRKKFPFYLFFVIPIVYFVSVVPAWLAGSPLLKLLALYYSQLDLYHALSMRAPNLYMFIDPRDYFDAKVLAGIIFTGIIVISYIILRWKRWKELDSTSIYFDVVFFTILIPFFLPKMHERYFFTGSLLLIMLALHDRKLVGLAVLMQASSLLSYIPYFSGWPDIYAQIGAVLNCAVIVGLFIYYRDFRKLSQTHSSGDLQIQCQN
jgi:Gpi18-like mannosyltransferase